MSRVFITVFPGFIEAKTSPMSQEREARQGIGASISTGRALAIVFSHSLCLLNFSKIANLVYGASQMKKLVVAGLTASLLTLPVAANAQGEGLGGLGGVGGLSAAAIAGIVVVVAAVAVIASDDNATTTTTTN